MFTFHRPHLHIVSVLEKIFTTFQIEITDIYYTIFSQTCTVDCATLTASTEKKSRTHSKGCGQETGCGIVGDRTELLSELVLPVELDSYVDLNCL